MKSGLHHIHKRKIVYEKLEKYPSKNKWVRRLDRFLLFFAIFGPLSALPQIMKIFYLQNASGVSTITYSLWSVGVIPWIIYGYVHKTKPIMIAYSLWFFMYVLIVVGSLIY